MRTRIGVNKMKQLTLAAALCCLASTATLAQVVPPDLSSIPASREEVEAEVNLGNFQNAYRRLIQQGMLYRLRYHQLDEYLKKCGDKPGCTVPIENAGTFDQQKPNQP
jgi:hypothetical protein